MSWNGWTHFKNLAAFAEIFAEVCVTILGHDALNG